MSLPPASSAASLDGQDEVGRVPRGGQRARTHRGFVDRAAIPQPLGGYIDDGTQWEDAQLFKKSSRQWRVEHVERPNLKVPHQSQGLVGEFDES